MHAVILWATLASSLPDRGIFSDLAPKVATAVPSWLPVDKPWLRVDPRHHLATLYSADTALQVWPWPLTAADRAELDQLAPSAPTVTSTPTHAEDTDGDGIVDRLDILLGAKKLLFNGARYIERYVSLPYPNGDVPRSEGVCSDTVIRALRNAGIDLQKEVHEDILRAPAAYPMVERVDASINHRRVRTILPWFQRHFVTLPKGTPFLPGDIVFFDTFPRKEGPDHLGVVSDRLSATRHPLVINNWTDGATDAEMDLLSFVPVTHHFRAPQPSKLR